MEAVVALAVVLKRYTFRAVPGSDPGMTTGAHLNIRMLRRRQPFKRALGQHGMTLTDLSI